MQINLDDGVYVVAVSGGVDSVALLHALSQKSDEMKLKFIVAHYDHGIRSDSRLDRELVQDYARKLNHQFVYAEGQLGLAASEDLARQKRYEFLRTVLKSARARAIITAHHQDDLIETAILNLLRGSGRRGVVSLRSRGDLLRPLLEFPKIDIVNYATTNNLAWREDSTNQDFKYKRNLVRQQIIPKLSDQQKAELLRLIKQLHDVNHQLEHELINHLHIHPGYSELNRHWFIMLAHDSSREVMHTWLMRHKITNMTSKKLEKIVAQAKTFQPNKLIDIDKNFVLFVGKDRLIIKPKDR